MPTQRLALLLAPLLLSAALAGCLNEGSPELQATVEQSNVSYGDHALVFVRNTGDAPVEGVATLAVVNATSGVRVRTITLMNGTPVTLEPGERRTLVWDGRTNAGQQATWGDYRLVARVGDLQGVARVHVEKPLVRYLHMDAPEKNVTQGDPVPLRLLNDGEVGFQGRVRLTIMNNTRRNVVAHENFTNVRLDPGDERTVYWDGRTDGGAPAPPGRYLARVVFSDGERADVPSTDWFSIVTSGSW